jgi:hypothetical protein
MSVELELAGHIELLPADWLSPISFEQRPAATQHLLGHCGEAPLGSGVYGRGGGLPAPGPGQGPVGGPDTPGFLFLLPRLAACKRTGVSACQQSPRDGGKSGKAEKNARSLT